MNGNASKTDGDFQLQQRTNALLGLWNSEHLQRGVLVDRLREITHRATDILHVERVGIWLYSDDRTSMRCLDLYERTPKKHSSEMEIDDGAYPVYFRALRENRAIAADDAYRDPRTAEFASQYLPESGVTSLLDAPIRGPNGLRGVLCHEHVGGVRHWTSEDQMFAASLADLVSNVLEAESRSTAEEALRESERQLRSLFEDSPDAIFVEDHDGNVLDVNPAACRLHGYERDELVGMNVLDLVPTGERDEVAKLFAQLVRGEISQCEGYSLTRDGQSIPIELTASQFIYQGRQALLLHVRDITPRREAQEALRRSENRYRILVETSHDLIWSVDVRGCWTFVNRQAALSIYGFEPEEMLGRPFTDFLDPDAAKRDLNTFARVKAGEHLRHYETVHRRKNGEPVYLSFHAVPHFDDHGKLIGTTGSASDISARKLAEAELARQREKLARVSQLSTLGQMVGGLAHELSQPLSAVSNYVAACKARIEQLDVPEKEHLVHLIRQATLQAGRAADILRQLRGSVRGASPLRAPLDVNRVIRESLKLVDAELADQAVQVETHLATDAPAAMGDRVQLQQVLVNLIQNAIDAMKRQPAATRRLTIRSWTDRVIHVAIIDQGPGVPADQREQCFDTFFTTKPDGMGMGLAICQSIIAEHDGRIWLESSESGGAKVEFTLQKSNAPLPAQP
ncbi:MAG: PAS domain S-box protein [Planctomycetales bacterium]|nr:PAS domain S-box protein [Planctomycetales bacterium]